MHRIVTMVILLVVVTWGLPVKADIYKWVDENGVTHYSNAKPPDHIAKKAGKMEEWAHDSEAHATRIKVTEAFQESELQKFYDEKRTAAEVARARAQQTAEMERKINFERQRLEGLIHDNRSAAWNAQVKSLMELLAEDPESYFQFQLEQTGPQTALAPGEQSTGGESARQGNELDLYQVPRLVDPHTGERFPEEGGVGSRGTHYIKSGDGYLNTKTGRFFEAVSTD